MDFAMILNSNVIDVVKDVESAPFYPPTLSGGIITAVECTGILVGIGMLYKDGIFLESETPIPSEPTPTDQEILQAEMLLNQQQIISKQTEIDMTLAELLLNQQGVQK